MTSIALQSDSSSFSPPTRATTGAFEEARPDPLALMLAIMVPLSAGFWAGIGWLILRMFGWFGG